MSSLNNYHRAQFSHGLRINEKPACQAPGGSFPNTSCFRVINRYPVLNARDLGGAPPRMLVSGWNCTSLANLHCMAMSVLFNWSCCSGLSQTGSLSPPLDISAFFPGLDSVTDNPWCSFPGYSFLRLLQLHQRLTPTGNVLGQWNMPRLHLHLVTPRTRAVLKGHHLQTGAAGRSAFTDPLPTTLRLGPKSAYFPSSWSSQFRAISVEFLFLLYSFLFPLLLPSALHSCSLRPLQWPPHHSRPRLPNHPIPFCLFNLSKTQV